MANITALVEPLVVAQNQPPPPPLSPRATQQTIVASEVPSVPISVTLIIASQYWMP